MKFCSKCGKKLNGDTKFCVYCGNLLKVTADPVKSTSKKQESEACVSNITPMGKKTKIKATLKKALSRHKIIDSEKDENGRIIAIVDCKRLYFLDIKKKM